MTKIKNTKKGMAKKTLSISLAVAMLATSNVPVWAAEDLFTDDATVAVEAPVEDAFTDTEAAPAEAEAPVVEEEKAVSAKSEVSGAEYTATITPFKFNDAEVKNNEFVWEDNKRLTTTLTVTDKEVIEGDDVYAVWKVNGEVDGNPKKLEFTDNEATLDCYRVITSANATDKIALYVYAEKRNDVTAKDEVVWSYTSDEITVNPKNTEDFVYAEASDVQYTGTTNKSEPTVYSKDVTHGIPELVFNDENYTIGYDEKVDLVNVTGKSITITLTPKSKAYKGSITATYKITPKELSGSFDEWMKATIKNTSIKFNGGDLNGQVVKVKKSDIELIDKESKADLSNYLAVDSNGYVNVSVSATGDAWVSLVYGVPSTGDYKNYDITVGENNESARRIKATNILEVEDRDLSSVDVTIARKRKTGNKITLSKGDVTFKDKETKETLDLWDYVDVTIPNEAVEVGVYTVTIAPKATVTKVTGTTSADLYIYASDVNDALFINHEKSLGNGYYEIIKATKYYDGEEIRFSSEEIGVPTLADGTPLKATDYEITYANNTNAGTAYMYLIGKDSYVNSLKKYLFTIKQTPVTSTFANDYVEKISDDASASDYKDAMGIVVKAKVPGTNKELTLVDGKDYKVTYSFETNNGKKYVKAEIDILDNGNFADPTGNITLTKYAEIVRATLKPEYVKLKENSFTYNGQAIEPEFDVVIGGHVIPNDGSAYSYQYTHNVDAGTAELIVEGEGDYKGKVTVNFTIQSADAEDLVGAIGTREYKGYSIEIAPEDIDLTLDGKRIDVANNFTLTFGENINIGEGTVTLTPKNNNFTGSKTLTFKITGEMLNGTSTFKYVDENGFIIIDSKKYFDYDGTAHKFAKTTLDYKPKTLKEGTDYDIVYVDNVYGQKGSDNQYAAVLAVAKGKYGGNLTKTLSGITVKDGIYTDAEGNKIVNVFAFDTIKINQQVINKSNVTVSNGTYAGGLPVKPEVSIVVKGRTLVEGQDYDLDLTGNKNLVDATEKQSLVVKIVPKNGYKYGGLTQSLEYAWGIDKFNFENADVTVKDGKVVVKCGKVDVDASEYTTTVDDVNGTTTITAVKDSKNYTGSKTIYARTEDQKPAAPMLVDVKVVGNKATAVLSGESEGATGYDYVISKDRDCITNKDYDKVNKNILTTNTTFTYTQQGTYYAYCHAWKRDENGKKVFSDWSNAYPFVVTAITPDQPVITSVKANGSTVTVTYTKAANATGYDVVLGANTATVAGEKRPVNYGTLVKKNIKGNTVTATFKDVPKGTYYAGLHAFNRTSEDGKKVFSPWSNAKKVTVK